MKNQIIKSYVGLLASLFMVAVIGFAEYQNIISFNIALILFILFIVVAGFFSVIIINLSKGKDYINSLNDEHPDAELWRKEIEDKEL